MSRIVDCNHVSSQGRLSDSEIAREQLEREYKLAADPAWSSRRRASAMYWTLPGKNGEIYPYGESELAMMVTSIRTARKILRLHPELKLAQSAADALVFVFGPDFLPLALAYIKPRRKRRLSEVHRKILAEASRMTRFVKNSTVPKMRPKSATTTLTATSRPEMAERESQSKSMPRTVIGSRE